MNEIWVTLEDTPRRLIAVGRSSIDPDVLVAYPEGSTDAVWIIDGGGKIDRCMVTKLKVRASRVRDMSHAAPEGE